MLPVKIVFILLTTGIIGSVPYRPVDLPRVGDTVSFQGKKYVVKKVDNGTPAKSSIPVTVEAAK